VIQISARPRRRPPTRRRRVRRWSTSAKVIVGGAVFLAVKAALDHLVITLTVLALALTVAGLLIGRRIQRRGRVRARDVLRLFSANPHRMNPDQFEEYLAELCRRDGCRQVTVVGGAGDLAADVLYTDPHGRRGLIQAKRYRTGNNVGSEHVQCVNGTYRDAHHCQHAAIVTTSAYTRDAADFAARVGITLLDAHRLEAWAGGNPAAAPWN